MITFLQIVCVGMGLVGLFTSHVWMPVVAFGLFCTLASYRPYSPPKGRPTTFSLTDPDGTRAMARSATAKRSPKAEKKPNSKGKGDMLPLVAATAIGNVELVKMMLEEGENPNISMPNAGLTVLMHAALKNKPEIAQALLDGGAHLDLVAQNGWTALMSAAYVGSVETAKVLLDNGADPDIVSISGKTAWDIAQEAGKQEICDLLLSHSSTPSIIKE